MLHWARSSLGLFNKQAKDCSLQDDRCIDLRDANLRGADLSASHQSLLNGEHHPT